MEANYDVEAKLIDVSQFELLQLMSLELNKLLKNQPKHVHRFRQHHVGNPMIE